ncbi:M28 family peptidase [Candidatus Poribacteria bacterium]|nr:M28 family peptidase [Candidatus Poribacteria bacterium]
MNYSIYAYPNNGDELLSKITTESLISHVNSLQENVSLFPNTRTYQTRNTHNREATENVIRYIKRMFTRSSRLRVVEQEIGGIKNIIAVLPPKTTSLSKKVLIVCAYYDSQAIREPDWNPLASTAPGANKNGTGMAALLEIANILSQYEYDHEIRFIALGGEELGFLGSRNYVREIVLGDSTQNEIGLVRRNPTSEDIVAVFNLDMIGFNWKSDLVEVISNRESVWLSRSLEIANRWYDIGLKIRRTVDEFVDISSHKTFWDSGYAAVTLIESSTPWRDSQNYNANPFYHTFQDTIDKVNFNLVTKVTKLMVVTIDSILVYMMQSAREIPQLTLNLPSVVDQNPMPVSGTFISEFPIDIVIHPSGATVKMDRENSTYSANIPLSPGDNTVYIVARYPLGGVSVKRTVILKEDFVWKDIIVAPNPVRFDKPTEFRVEGNLEISSMKVNIYDVHGNIIKRIDGIGDRLDRRVWRTWWNQKTSYGLAVSGGIYICHIIIKVEGKKYTDIKRLAIIR